MGCLLLMFNDIFFKYVIKLENDVYLFINLPVCWKPVCHIGSQCFSL